jgi:hypothetical protein
MRAILEFFVESFVLYNARSREGVTSVSATPANFRFEERLHGGAHGMDSGFVE